MCHNHRNHDQGPYHRNPLDASLWPDPAQASSRKRGVSSVAVVVARPVAVVLVLMYDMVRVRVRVHVQGQMEVVAVLRTVFELCYLQGISLEAFQIALLVVAYCV